MDGWMDGLMDGQIHTDAQTHTQTHTQTNTQRHTYRQTHTQIHMLLLTSSQVGYWLIGEQATFGTNWDVGLLGVGTTWMTQ